jgi:hypothetical protein
MSPVYIAAGGGRDTLNINASDPSGTKGECSYLKCTGFGTSGAGIQWTTALETVHVICGTGDDLITVSGVAADSLLTIDGGTGSDEYTIRAASTGLTEFGQGSSLIISDFTLGGTNLLAIDLGILHPCRLHRCNTHTVRFVGCV